MSITIENLGENFVNRLSKKHIDYIINFCNTFQKTFPGIFDNEALIQKILTINSMQQVSQLNYGEGGRTEYYAGKNDITYLDNLPEEDEKNIIYHELFHVLSRHTEFLYDDTAGLTIGGIRQYEANPDDFYEENGMLDEIMNEFYTVKLLETEGEIKEKAYTLTVDNYKLNPIKNKFRYFGNGYKEYAQLAEILNYIFGNDLLKAKLISGKSFREMFNQKYKDLDISMPQNDNLPSAKGITPYERFQFQIGLSGIYKPFETAIDIWKTNEKERLKENDFNLYEYLKRTNELISFLPVQENNGTFRNDKKNTGIPQNISSKLQQMDSEFISEYINPDIMKVQDEDGRKREINTLLSVINILRENIQDLSEQDIENISYGKIEEYTHSGKNCLIINTKSTDFMTFVNSSAEQNYQFSAYSKFKKITEYKEWGYTEETEKELSQELAKNGYNVKDFAYATVMDGGRYSRWSLVKSNGSYYRTSGEISEVQMTDTKSLRAQAHKFKSATLDTELHELVSETKSTDFNEMSQNIKNIERVNETSKSLDNERI